MNADRDLIVALARGFQVLECFGPRRTSLALSEIASKTGLAKATVARILYTLVNMGYMHQTVDRRYSLSPAVLVLAHPVLASMPIRQIAQPLMRQLAQDIGGTVSMGVLDRGSVVYVETCRSAPNPEHLPDIGVIWPIIESAIGRAVLVSMKASERTKVINKVKVREPERWKRQEDSIKQALQDYADHGYCVSLQEVRPGFVGVGVPFPTLVGEHRVAFNCSVPAVDPSGAQMRRDVAPKLVELVDRLHSIHRNFEAAELSATQRNWATAGRIPEGLTSKRAKKS